LMHCTVKPGKYCIGEASCGLDASRLPAQERNT
jgi:hypothetical protein